VGPFAPGELSWADAQKLNDLWQEVEQFKRLAAAPPLQLNRAAGIPQLTLFGLPDDVLLCEVVSDNGLSPPAHVVKRKTRDGSNNIVDLSPLTTLANVLNPAGEPWDTGALVGVTRLPDQQDYRWGWPATAPIYAVVESGTDATYYTCTPIHLTGPNAWTRYGDHFIGYRAPSVLTGTGYPPDIPVGQVVVARPATAYVPGGGDPPVAWEITPWGGIERVLIVTDVTCSPTLVVTKQYLYGRDLYLLPL
jgi:hypothetical protein